MGDLTKGTSIANGVISQTSCMVDAEDQRLANWADCCKATTKGESNHDLTVAIALLAAQVWALRRSKDRDALLAIEQIGKRVDDFRERQAARDA